MEFTAHASSSAGNLYTVFDGRSRLAIECGLRMAEIQQALEFRTASLAGALVSHHHQDHAKAVRYLMTAGVDVYASAPTWSALDLRSHRAHTLEPLELVQIGPWRVLPFDLRHDAEGALGFLVANGRDRLLYACDTAFVPYRFEGLTHIAIECNYSRDLLHASDAPAEQKARVLRHHMGLERVLALLEANGLSRVREIHLLHLSDRHSDEELFREAVRSATGKPTYVAPRALIFGRRGGDPVSSPTDAQAPTPVAVSASE